MSILNAQNISLTFGDRKILEETSFRLLNGEHVGLVGANGEGKSTFLKLIIGEIQSDSGKIEWQKRITTGYLDQHVKLTKGKTIRDVLREAFQYMYDLEKELLELYDKMADCAEEEMNKALEDVGDIQYILEHNGFYEIDAKINEVASGLGLFEIGLEKDVTELSGGQRSKVLLTKLLLQNPMILILDEPTNFLDEGHIKWLKDFLKGYENAFILVSHDIPFLNEVVNVIYHIDNAEMTRYSGNYDFFLSQVDLKKEQNEKAFKKQQKEIEQLETFIAKNKARAATANMAKSRQKKLEKMDIIELSKERIKPKFDFKEGRAPTKVVVSAKDLVIGYDRPLTRPLHFTIERGSKIALRGVNGIGKSTLLKTILGLTKPFEGQVELGDYVLSGYFEQEEKTENITAHEYLWNIYPNMTNGEVRGALARCGLTTKHISSSMRVLSGGECAKVRLCKIMNQEINLLVLDEPTNHLDVDAKEELKRAIIGFKGTVILVSHEPEFYNDAVREVWNVEDWIYKK